MHINEAVKKAMEQSCYIARTSIDDELSFHPTKISPTNSYANCIVYTFDQSGKEVHHCKNWNPSAEDLMADDWELTN